MGLRINMSSSLGRMKRGCQVWQIGQERVEDSCWFISCHHADRQGAEGRTRKLLTSRGGGERVCCGG